MGPYILFSNILASLFGAIRTRGNMEMNNYKPITYLLAAALTFLPNAPAHANPTPTPLPTASAHSPLEQALQSPESTQSSPVEDLCAPHELLRTLKTRYEKDMATIRLDYGDTTDATKFEDIPGGIRVRYTEEGTGVNKIVLSYTPPPDGVIVVGHEINSEFNTNCVRPSFIHDISEVNGTEQANRGV